MAKGVDCARIVTGDLFGRFPGGHCPSQASNPLRDVSLKNLHISYIGLARKVFLALGSIYGPLGLGLECKKHFEGNPSC